MNKNHQNDEKKRFFWTPPPPAQVQGLQDSVAETNDAIVTIGAQLTELGSAVRAPSRVPGLGATPGRLEPSDWRWQCGTARRARPGVQHKFVNKLAGELGRRRIVRSPASLMGSFSYVQSTSSCKLLQLHSLATPSSRIA